MLRVTRRVLENWREEFHRIHGPRRVALTKWLAARDEAKSKPATAFARPNRWWVSNNGDFIEQVQVIEDPRVIERIRTTLPDPTHEDLWKKNQCPTFTPFEALHQKVIDYPEDPDAKHLYATNLPKWKDFMKRNRPPLPRTWY